MARRVNRHAVSNVYGAPWRINREYLPGSGRSGRNLAGRTARDVHLGERRDMIYAIISDIHANLEALDAVLAEIDEYRRRRRCTAWATSSATTRIRTRCVELVLSRAAEVVRGNHDKAVAGLLEPGLVQPRRRGLRPCGPGHGRGRTTGDAPPPGAGAPGGRGRRDPALPRNALSTRTRTSWTRDPIDGKLPLHSMHGTRARGSASTGTPMCPSWWCGGRAQGGPQVVPMAGKRSSWSRTPST